MRRPSAAMGLVSVIVGMFLAVGLSGLLPGPLGLGVAAGQATPGNAAEALEQAVVEAINRARPAVVGVNSYKKDGKLLGRGTGFIVDAQGHLLTNHHVVAKADRVEAVFSEREKVTARVLGGDASSDLSVLKIEPKSGLTTVTIGNSDAIRPGQLAIAIGNPMGLEKTITLGVISAVGRYRGDVNSTMNMIQTDAAINPGNSGGPLLNIRGEVVGINSATLGRGLGLNFAIPINDAMKVMAQLLEHGKVVRGFLGVIIQPVTPELARKFGVKPEEGAVVGDLSEGSPAGKAGVRRGDVIVAMDGKPVLRVRDVRQTTAGLAPGRKVKLQVIRDGKPQEIEVTLGEQKRTASIMEKLAARYGVDVREVTPELAKEFKLDRQDGLLVYGVSEGGLAERKGLKKGDVILEIERRPVDKVDEIETALGQLKEEEGVLLLIRRDGRTSYLVVAPYGNPRPDVAGSFSGR
ncbi:MAG: trypsin-like peptidase domain-containing protein [Deltaproteobacteria bacterium]|nr:trypsin-like peptidase domain-containing protein [Deltaproteobacteria bacterium]